VVRRRPCADPPVIEIVSLARLIGPSGDLDVTVESASRQLTRLDVTLEQSEGSWPVFALPGAEPAQLVEEGEHCLRLRRPIGKREVPGLEAGPLTVRVTAVRLVLFRLREIGSSAPLIATVELAVVLPAYALDPMGIYGVYRSRKQIPLIERSFLDFIAARFGEDPEWERALQRVPSPTMSES
jgi:hypothetical protein